MKSLASSLIFLIVVSSPIFADSPRMAKPVRFTNLNILGELRPGQIVTLCVEMQAVTAIEGDLVVHFPQRVFKRIMVGDDSSTSVHLTLKPEESVKKYYQMTVEGYGEGMFQVSFIATNTPHGYARNAGDHLRVYVSTNSSRLVRKSDTE